MLKTKFNITGMSCAACSARVEKAVSKVSGVSSCQVNLLTNSMTTEGEASVDEIISAVVGAGYGASVAGGPSTSGCLGTKIANTTDPNATTNSTDAGRAELRRLISSIIFLIPLLYVSMGHTMWGAPLPQFFSGNHIAIALVQMIFAAVVMVINQKFFTSGFKSLLRFSPNMDSLVALGSAASFVYSVTVLFSLTDTSRASVSGVAEPVEAHLYFESAAMILTLITVGKMLEARSKGKTTTALKGLMNLAPKTATILADGEEKIVPIEMVKVGDIFVVKPGDSVPVDGIIIEGTSAINEASITGESIPRNKSAGEEVTSATINTFGFLKCRAIRVGEDTTLSKIIQMVSDASSSKAPISKIADKVSAVFVPTVILIAVLTFVVWLLVGKEIGFALARGISVLVISCPCALGLATPVAIMVGNGVGAKNGILFKTAESLEETGKVKIVALDKTGTVTKGEPKVTGVFPVPVTEALEVSGGSTGSPTEIELLKTALAVEKKSEHPLAKAIVNYCEENKIETDAVEDFQVVAGMGVKGTLNDEEVLGGKWDFVKPSTASTGLGTWDAEALEASLWFTKNGKLLGAISVADTIKEDSPDAIRALKEMGIRVVLLTGDNEKTAREIADRAGIEEVASNVLPDGKASVIENLKKQGKVAMVGDGINDAPALTTANIGIAIGNGTDIAIDAADVVLMKNSLVDAASSIKLSRKTLKNIKENLFWAFIYNVIGIPLAAGVWIPIFGWTLNPMFGAAAMSLSSFSVVSNALRLNWVKLYNANRAISGDTNAKTEVVKTESAPKEQKMTTKITVKGMMCANCERHEREAIEKIDGVTSVVADHENNLVTIESTKEIPLSELEKATKEAGYEFCGAC